MQVAAPGLVIQFLKTFAKTFVVRFHPCRACNNIEAVVGFCTSISIVPAQAATEVRVATRVLPPMVMSQDGALSGFSIELWNEIAKRTNMVFKYEVYPDVRSLLESVQTGKADLGIAAISITAAREEVFSFSHPILNSGLQILIGGGGNGAAENPLGDLLSLLFSRTSVMWLLIAFLLALGPAHLVWLVERRHAEGIIPTTRYFPGIFYAFYWAVATLTTQSDTAPRQWLARVVAIFWMFSSIVFVALYTAQLTATLTVKQINAGISGPEDLAGKRVAVTKGSTAAKLVGGLRAEAVEFSKIDEVYQALHDKSVDAVVFDSPVLMHYAANEGKGRVTLVGPPFGKEDYGIVFPQGSKWLPITNVALLRIKEDGTYQRLHEKWFGVAK